MQRNRFDGDKVGKALGAGVALALCCSPAWLAAAPVSEGRLPTGENAAATGQPGAADAGVVPGSPIAVEAEIGTPGASAGGPVGVFDIHRSARVSSRFGTRRDPLNGDVRMHAGIDLPKPFGSPVTAGAAGRVVFAGWAGGYGNMIEIDHGGGLSTRYGHLSSIEVVRSSFVAGGQRIGRVGSTGRSTGSHLHYEVRVNGRAVDPQSGRLPIGRGSDVAPLLPWVAAEAAAVPQRQEWSSPLRDGLLPQAIIE